VSYRDRLDGDLGAVALGEAVRKLKAEVDARTIRQVVASPVIPEEEAAEKHAY
jgi:threonyl-tRNA synthetase